MKHNKKGFSLLEVIIAIFVIIIGIVGAMNLLNYSISSAVIGKSQIIASNLAQEGIEIVRNIRDSNWLKGAVWTTGLDGCSSGCRAQYNKGSLLLLFDNPALRIDENGFYQYDSGPDALFHRKITISSISVDEIKVVSEVTWYERGRSHIINAEDRLYDWK